MFDFQDLMRAMCEQDQNPTIVDYVDYLDGCCVLCQNERNSDHKSCLLPVTTLGQHLTDFLRSIVHSFIDPKVNVKASPMNLQSIDALRSYGV